jgi:hypothetical protein
MKTAGDSLGRGERAQGAFLRWLPWIAVPYACALALLLARQPDVVGAVHDDGVYLSMARSIEQGLGPVDGHLGADARTNRFPPAFPLVLALARPLLGVERDGLGGVHRLVALNGLWLGVALFAFLRWTTAWKRWPPWLAVASAALVFTLPCVVGLAQHLMSESLLLAELGVALLLVERAVATTTTATATATRVSRTSLLLAGLVAGLMAATKTAAAALVVGLALFVLARRRSWRAAATFATAALAPWVAAAAWSAASRAVSIRESALFGPPYLHLLRENLGRLPTIVAVNAVRFADLACTLFAPGLPAANGVASAALRVAVVLAAVAVVAIGARRGRRGVELFVVVAGALALLPWPFADLRFLVPLAAVAVVALVEALRRGAVPTRRGAAFGASVAMVGLAAWNGATVTSKCLAARAERDELPLFWAPPVKLAPWRETAAWLARETQPDERFASTQDALLAVTSGRPGVSSWRNDLPFVETYLGRAANWRQLFGDAQDEGGRWKGPPPVALDRMREFTGSVLAEYRRLGVRNVVFVRAGWPGVPLHESLVGALLHGRATASSFERVFTTSDGAIEVWKVRES